MKRQIKFRGKKHDDKEWVWGSLHDYSPIGRSIYVNNTENETTEGFTVYSHTVGQFTGLKDKNGVDIYEGDIVRDRFGRIMSVGYWNYRMCFIAISETNFHHADFFDWVDIKSRSTDDKFPEVKTTVEIIGNKFDNPILLNP